MNHCIGRRNVFEFRRPIVNKSPTYVSENTILLDMRGGASKRSNTGKKVSSKTHSIFNKDKITNSSLKKTATGGTSVGLTQKQSAFADSMQKYKSILPMTRIYITLVAATTLLGLILGDELTQSLLALDPIRILYGFQIWRPITAACFLGPPSIGWLFSAYYLFEYGSSLERAYGTAQHIVFLVGQVLMLSFASSLFRMPFFGSSVITAMLHVLSRSMPNQKVQWLIFKVPYWTLPYGQMIADVLQTQSATAALPHILGIITGHFYFFHRFIWPKIGGEDWLIAPSFLAKKFDPNYYDSSEKDNEGKRSIETALKQRRKGMGRMLGSK